MCDSSPSSLFDRINDVKIDRKGDRTTLTLPDDIPVYLQCVLVNEALRRAEVGPVELVSVEIVED